jgi:AraC-like DNA-binding protein
MTQSYLQSHCRLATTDLDEAREHVGRMWERHESHLSSGRTYCLRWNQVDFRRTSLTYIHSGSALHVKCGPVGDRFRFTMPEAGMVYHRINGRGIQSTATRGVVYAPQQELQLEIEPFRSLLLTIDADFVKQAARLRFGKSPDFGYWTTAVSLDMPPAATLRSLCRWLGHELDRPGTPLRSSRQIIAGLERSLLTLFLDCLTAVSGAAGDGPDSFALAQLCRIESWLDEHFCEPIGVEDLALVAGVGVRAVQNMFRRHRGCTPSEAIVQRRLTYARRRLIEADPQTTVTDVAFDCGFFHLSRFAARYRHAFGERPSQTLADRLRATA